MERLRERLRSPSSATGFTILHGLGGIGKTSLAVEYAHNFAHEYPAGRWQAKCGGAADLNEALTRLASRLGVDFHPQEPAASSGTRSASPRSSACIIMCATCSGV